MRAYRMGTSSGTRVAACNRIRTVRRRLEARMDLAGCPLPRLEPERDQVARERCGTRRPSARLERLGGTAPESPEASAFLLIAALTVLPLGAPRG
jgi:hypothetical protein